MDSVTTDEALRVLSEKGLKEAVLGKWAEKVEDVISRKAGENMNIGVITFSRATGYLAETKHAQELLEILRR